MPTDGPLHAEVRQFRAMSALPPPPPLAPRRTVPSSTVIIVLLSCALLLSLSLLYVLAVRSADSRCVPYGRAVCASTDPQPTRTPVLPGGTPPLNIDVVGKPLPGGAR
ncbi:hypothetical protein JS756_31810 [Streptomyces actuosus]|uniref:Uncharacterized protein n=1 Tax=Streptomyces actuosus TaxID=1885 RepID=A0ABS2VZM4_STRAS|nr:hypothetical protein [Streptomyces actuosus]MBN0048597.1 hypothetical protein [Streptomyces actuosus]